MPPDERSRPVGTGAAHISEIETRPQNSSGTGVPLSPGDALDALRGQWRAAHPTDRDEIAETVRAVAVVTEVMAAPPPDTRGPFERDRDDHYPGGWSAWCARVDRLAALTHTHRLVVVMIKGGLLDTLTLDQWEAEITRPPDPPDLSDVGTGWVRAVLVGECDTVAAAPSGTRNGTLNTAAFKIGRKCLPRGLPRDVAEAALYAAAIACGHVRDNGPRATRATIASGLDGGQRAAR